MESLISIFETALPVFLALILGMLCRRLDFLNRDGVETLKKVVLQITLPAVVLSSFATAEYSTSTIAVPVVMFLLCCLGLVLGFLFSRLFRIQSRLAPYLATGFEAGMLGYALFALLFRDEGISRFAILDLGQVLFVFTLYKALLSGGKDKKALLHDAVTSPILWAIVLGVLIGATGLFSAMERSGIAGIFTSLTDFVSAPTGMIILLTVGYDLVPKEIPWRQTGGLILLRLGVMAILLGLLILLNRTLLGGVVHEGAAMLMFLLPPPYVLPVFANEPSERTKIASALSALTVVSMLLYALLSVFVGLR